MKNESIRLGVLGCSSFAERLFLPNLKTFDGIELVGIASRDASKAAQFASKFNCRAFGSYQSLIEDEEIDAVYMPLPISMHKEWILKSLEAGKHVLVEKSITASLADTEEVLKLAKQTGKCVFENFMFPFHSQMQFVREKLAANTIGEIRQLRSSFGFPVFDKENNIRYKSNLGGGALLDAGAYTVLAAQLFLGKELKVLGALLNKQDYEVDFNGSALLVNEHGIPASLSFGFDHFYQNSIEIWGTEGKLTMKRAFTAGPGIRPVVEIETKDGVLKYECEEDNHLHRMMEQFMRACNHDPSFQFDQVFHQSKLLSEISSLAAKY